MRALFKLPVVAGLVAICLAWTSVALAQPDEAIESYVLGNGLTVVIAPDHRVPKVAVTLRYRVGSANEPVGRSGFAHLFEHLMFAGTPTYPNIDATLSAQGLSYNATTEEDATTYYAAGMASALPVILSVQADQMGNIGASVTQSDFDTQRSVVLNEMRQNVLDSPGTAALTALQSGMFPADHPYHRATIGSIADLDAATLGDVRAFFDAYYVPANATLVIVGDIELAATKALVADTFGRVARVAPLALPAVPEAAPTRVRIDDTDAVATPMVFLGFSGPVTTDAEDAALLIASDLLSNEGGPLRALVSEGVATFAAGGWSPGDLGGRFLFYGGAAPGTTPENLEQRLRAAIAGFVAAPIDPTDLERSRSAFLVGFRNSLEAYAPRADFIADVMSDTGTVEGVLGVPPELLDVTAADVEREMRRILVDADVSIAVIRPGARGDYPAVLREPSGEAQPLKVANRAPVEIPVLAAGEPKAAVLPPRQTATLSNGIKLVHYRMEGAPMAYLSVVVSGGSNNEPRGKEGIYEMALEMGPRGAGARDEEQLANALRDIGGVIGTWSGATRSGATISVVPEKFADGIDLLADVVETPRFDDEPWAVLRARTLQHLVQRDSDLDASASRALNRTVFVPGPDDPGIEITAEGVNSITLDEARAVYEELFVPASMTLYSVGDLPIEDVVAAVEPRFGKRQDARPAVAAKPPLQPVFGDGPRILFVPVAGAAQATIQITRPAPGYEDGVYPQAIAVTNLLAGDFTSRLNTVIREEKGYSYGVNAGLWSWLRHDGGLTVSIPVQADATGAALAESIAGFGSLVSAPVTDIELKRSLMSYLTAQAGLTETAGGFFGALVGWEKDGVELDSLVRFLQQLTELKLDDVRKVASDLAGLDRALIVVAGDPDIVLPQLTAAGYTDIATVDLSVPAK